VDYGKVSYSINFFDEDGEVFDECVLLHLENGVILRFDNVADIDRLTQTLTSISKEIRGATDGIK